jgi:hypothetical protein
LYDDILFLVDGIVATGAGAFHAGGSSQIDLASQDFNQSQSQPENESQNDPQLPVTPVRRPDHGRTSTEREEVCLDSVYDVLSILIEFKDTPSTMI